MSGGWAYWLFGPPPGLGDGARDRFPYGGIPPGRGEGERGLYTPPGGPPPAIGLGEGALERDSMACGSPPAPRYGEGARYMSGPCPDDGYGALGYDAGGYPRFVAPVLGDGGAIGTWP